MSINGLGANYVNNVSTQRLNTAQESLASGKRINSATDDPAGLQVANRLTSQIDGNGQAIANSMTGISVTQIAQSGLASVTNDLNALRDIAVEAGNGIYTAEDRQALQQQADSRLQNIQATLSDTTFAGQELLTEEGSLGFQVGQEAENVFNVATNDIRGTLSANGLFGFDVNDPSSLETAIEAVDTSLDNVASSQADYGATQTAFSSRVDTLLANQQSDSAARTRIEDADYAATVSNQITATLLENSSTALQAQANVDAGRSLNLLSS